MTGIPKACPADVCAKDCKGPVCKNGVKFCCAEAKPGILRADPPASTPLPP